MYASYTDPQTQTEQQRSEAGMSTAPTNVDENEYDAFLARRDHDRMQQKMEQSSISDEKTPSSTADASMSPTSASPPSRLPSNPAGALNLPSSLTASFGTPITPASTLVRNRRFNYMMRVLHAAASDYFDPESVEQRWPELFHEYLGKHLKRLQGRREADDAIEMEEEQEEEHAAQVRKMKDETVSERLGGEHKAMMDETARLIPPSSVGASSAGAATPAHPSSMHSQQLPLRPSSFQSSGLPSSLSQLLLRNYDREQIRIRREAAATGGMPVDTPEQAMERLRRMQTSQRKKKKMDADEAARRRAERRAAAAAAAAAPNITNSSIAPPITEAVAPSSSDSESELESDDDTLPSLHPSRHRMTFAADDGSGDMDPDPSSNVNVAPTSSAQAAERARNMDWDALREVIEDAGTSAADSQPSALASKRFDSSVATTGYDANQGWLDLLARAETLFLDGYDSAHVNYAQIDADEENDDMREREEREQEDYFSKDMEDDDEEEAGDVGSKQRILT